MTLRSQQLREVTGKVADVLAVLETSHETEVSTDPALSSLMAELGDAALTGLLRDAAAARAQFETIITTGAGLVAKRSERELGYSGLAAREGHRSPVSLVQSLTGEGRGEAARQVRFGEAIGEADAAISLAGNGGNDQADGDQSTGVTDPDALSPVLVPWFEPITRAVTGGVLTTAGGEALMRGLGEPTAECDADVLREAALELLADAAGANTDELLKRARWVRDRIDPARVTVRAQERYRNRKARLRRNDAGVLTGWLEFDDESANLIEGIIRSGLSPRLGGPRFVDKDKVAAAQALLADPRSYEQLVFDLIMAVLKAGTLADPNVLLGGQQHGLRVVITHDELDKKDADGNLAGTGFVEDTGERVPPATIERMLCDTGVTEITVDGDGDPLNVGREHRLFTAKQRVALAIRDGGCMAVGCPFPASMAEAHHILEWHADHGRTDLADGILLCKFDHLRVHNQHWKIVRDGNRYFMVPPQDIDPDQAPIELHSKAPWRQQRHKKAG